MGISETKHSKGSESHVVYPKVLYNNQGRESRQRRGRSALLVKENIKFHEVIVKNSRQYNLVKIIIDSLTRSPVYTCSCVEVR